MTTEQSVIFAAIFLAAIPVNLYVAREFRHYASVRPQIASLTLLSRLVTVLAYAAIGTAVVSFVSTIYLATGIRVIPSPFPTLILVSVLLAASFANVLALGYLRKMSRPDDA